MSSMQEAREVWKDASDEVFDEMLWSCTPYPCNSVEDVANLLIKLHKDYNGDSKAVVNESMRAFDEEWKAHKLKYPNN